MQNSKLIQLAWLVCLFFLVTPSLSRAQSCEEVIVGPSFAEQIEAALVGYGAGTHASIVSSKPLNATQELVEGFPKLEPRRPLWGQVLLLETPARIWPLLKFYFGDRESQQQLAEILPTLTNRDDADLIVAAVWKELKPLIHPKSTPWFFGFAKGSEEYKKELRARDSLTIFYQILTESFWLKRGDTDNLYQAQEPWSNILSYDVGRVALENSKLRKK